LISAFEAARFVIFPSSVFSSRRRSAMKARISAVVIDVIRRRSPK
jgi:hypothetical protein